MEKFRKNMVMDNSYSLKIKPEFETVLNININYNEYIDLSITAPFFFQKSLNELDGDYYLAIQGKDNTFYNLYISSQDIKIITLDEDHPA